MSSLLRIAVCLLALLAPVLGQEAPPADPVSRGYRLVFADEFDGATLDRSKWADSFPEGRRTNDDDTLQYFAKDAVELRDGLLRLKAERRKLGGKAYTSGMVATFGKFALARGWWEARIKMPHGAGTWPSFQLLPADDDWPPEIQIVQSLGRDPRRIYMSLQPKAPGKKQPDPDEQPLYKDDWSEGFHTFAIEWKEDRITWYVDGIQRHWVTHDIPQKPMYLLLLLNVGGEWAGKPDPAVFPAAMEIDYVRVYAPSRL